MGCSGCGKCTNVPIRGIITVVGCTMVVFCFGIEQTFGNMNPYMTSYLRNRSENSHGVSYKDTLWVSTGKVVSASFFMPILCLLEQVIPSRICILIGAWTARVDFNQTGVFPIIKASSTMFITISSSFVILQCSAMAVTYFSISNGFIGIVFTEGVVYSMGKALAYPVSFRMAFRCFPQRKGLISGIMTASYGGSAFALNQVITKFINPDNLSPDQAEHDNRYFTQASLLDKVPYCYLLLGGILAVMSTIGILIMTDPGQKANKTKDNISLEEKVQPQGTDILEKTSPDIAIQQEQEEPIQIELSPMQTLQTRRFYNVWLMYFFVGFGVDIFSVLFKPFGETFITDDYFLALAASCAAVAMAIGNLIWGFLADKFTYKPVLMVLLCIFGSFLSTLITTEYGGEPMFFIWVCALYFSFAGVFVLLPLIAMDMFGTKHLSVNYGLIHSAGVAFSLLSALLTSQLKDIVGWHGIFLTAAGMTIMSLLMAIGIYTMKKWD